MSFTRINANIAALQSYNELLSVNRSVAQSLLRLSSGKRINKVGDDPAGFSLARGLESRRRSLAQALANVGTAKNVLAIAEGGYLSIADILQVIKEKVVQGADDSYNPDQRDAIQGQIDRMVEEIDDIVGESNFQGAELIDGTFINQLFQTGAGAGETFEVSLEGVASTDLSGFRDQFTVIAGVNDRIIYDDGTDDFLATIAAGTYTLTTLAAAVETALEGAPGTTAATWTVSYDSGTGKFTLANVSAQAVTIKWSDSASAGAAGLLGYSTLDDDAVAATTGTTVSDVVNTGISLDVASSATAAIAMANVDEAINTLNEAAQKVGEYALRLDSKEANLSVTITNTESARSRIEDADFAEEQMSLIRAQIVQQTAFASFAQANAAPQLVLSLFR